MGLMTLALVVLGVAVAVVLLAKGLERHERRSLPQDVRAWVRSIVTDAAWNARAAEACEQDRLVQFYLASRGLTQLETLRCGPWTEEDVGYTTQVNMPELRTALEALRGRALEALAAQYPGLDGRSLLGLAARTAMTHGAGE